MIYFFGDVHGNFRHVAQVVRCDRPSAIVFLGDLEAQRPLEQELRDVLGKTEVWFIHGNHDTDSEASYQNLFRSTLADRNLHGRVVEIAGIRVAGLGGVFREDIWHPSLPDAPVHFDSYAEYREKIESETAYLPKRNDSEVKARGRLLKHRSSIFYDDWIELHGQHADILVTHEAPSCHPHGFEAIDELARSLRIRAAFHGHHHDRLNYQPHWERLGFKAYGVGFCGVVDQEGKEILKGDFDEARMAREI